MTSQDIALHRLANQQITDSAFTKPADLVRWMGCIQAQDFAGAKWAMGNRIKGITDADIEKECNEGKILRTHILRPTWHFVLPEDIGWMLKLTAPRVKAFCKSLYRQLGIDDKILKNSRKIIQHALSGGKQLTRAQLLPFLNKGKINTDDIRLGLLLMDAELDGIICSGVRQGKQFTYVLLEERVPQITHLDTETAIAQLTKRYFVSRGPATLQDFAWWSGLNLTMAKRGIEMNKSYLSHEVVNAQAYWFSADQLNNPQLPETIHLLPPFDEYTVAYKDRSDIIRPKYYKQTGNALSRIIISEHGQVIGTWKAITQKDKIQIEANPFLPADEFFHKTLLTAADEYARFMGKGVESGTVA